MSLFGRKPSPNPAPGNSPVKGPSNPGRTHRHNNTTVPHSRQSEHASEAPNGIDSNFCYGDEQES